MILGALIVCAAARLHAAPLAEGAGEAPAPLTLPLSPAAGGDAAGRWVEGWLGARPEGLRLRGAEPIPALPASALAEPGALEAAPAEGAAASVEAPRPQGALPAAEPELAGPGAAGGALFGARAPLRDAVASPEGGAPAAYAPSLEALSAEGRRRFDQEAPRAAAALAAQAAAFRPSGLSRPEGPAGASAERRAPSAFDGAMPAAAVAAGAGDASAPEGGRGPLADRDMRGGVFRRDSGSAAAPAAPSAASAAPVRPPVAALTLVVARRSLSIVLSEADLGGAARLSARWASAAAARASGSALQAGAFGGARAGGTPASGGQARAGSSRRAGAPAAQSAPGLRPLSRRSSAPPLPWWWLLPLAALAFHYRREFV